MSVSDHPPSNESISELFARNPLSLTDADIRRIVEEYRNNRKRFLLGDKQAGSAKAKPKSAAAKAKAEAKAVVGKIDISDLL